MITLTSGERKRLSRVNGSYINTTKSSNCEKVDVSYAFFRTDESLNDFVKSLPQVASLSMKDSKIGCDCGKIHNLRSPPNVDSRLCHSKLTKEHLSTLFDVSFHLDLSHTSLYLRFPHEFERLESLATNTTLKSLVLSRNRMSMPGYNFLMTVLNTNTTLTTLSLGESATRHLSAKDANRFPDPFSFAVDHTILPFKNITYLDISGNSLLVMRNGGTRSHIVDIISNPVLVSFKFNGVFNVSPAEMTMILKSLTHNKTLEVFEMNESEFDFEDLQAIFSENDTLRTLDLGGNRYRYYVSKNVILDTCVTAIVNTTLTSVRFLSSYPLIDTMKRNMSMRNLTLYDHLIRYLKFDKFSPKRRRVK